MSHGSMMRNIIELLRASAAGIIDAVIPQRNIARVSDSRRYFHNSGRPEGVIEKLLSAVKTYQQKTKDRVTFEYVIIKGLNDSMLYAELLVRLLRGIKCYVNLIEYNPHTGCKFTGSSRETMSRFMEVIKEAGIKTSTRLKRGGNIHAACGQLGANSGRNQ